MHRIAVLLLPPVVGFDAAIAPTMFSTACDADGDPLYDVVTCALTDGPVESTAGFDVLPGAGPEALATAPLPPAPVGLDLPDPDDWPIIATAIVDRASTILTYDRGDFPHRVLGPYGLRARHPDRVLVAYRHLPLDAIHPHARAAGLDPGLFGERIEAHAISTLSATKAAKTAKR